MTRYVVLVQLPARLTFGVTVEASSKKAARRQAQQAAAVVVQKNRFLDGYHISEVEGAECVEFDALECQAHEVKVCDVQVDEEQPEEEA